MARKPKTAPIVIFAISPCRLAGSFEKLRVVQRNAIMIMNDAVPSNTKVLVNVDMGSGIGIAEFLFWLTDKNVYTL